MSDTPLTIGMATHKDFMGVYLTLKVLKDFHPTVELLVVDTSPGEGGPQTKGVTRAVGGRYVHRPDLLGTSAPRDAVVKLARTPWVMCVDSHVELRPGAVQAALDWIGANPDSDDLVSGPLVGDDGFGHSTHWRPACDSCLWGVWDALPEFRPEPGKPWSTWVKPAPDAVFEVPAQGLGLFMVRRAAWPGFHPLHRGFGGEEGYVSELYRRRGNRTLCLAGLEWSHVFRGPENPAPYKFNDDDIVKNLALYSAELGIPPVTVAKHGNAANLKVSDLLRIEERTLRLQPLGQPYPRPQPLKLLGVWYSNNAAPAKLLESSLGTVRTAADATVGHEVRVVTCPWDRIPGNPFPEVPSVTREKSHANIVRQQRQCAAWADEQGYAYDAVVFLEHDVLYPADYFDRMGDLLRTHPAAEAAVNLDYVGLNATGWLAVKERHEPLHQMALRREAFLANLDRCAADCEAQGWCYLEPGASLKDPGKQEDRKDWARYPHTVPGRNTPMSAVHVNHDAGRFTSHGEVVYEATASGPAPLVHPYWGLATDWWPAKEERCGGCGTANRQTSAPTADAPVRPAKPQGTGVKLETLDDLVKLAKESMGGVGPDGFDALAEVAARCSSAVDSGPNTAMTLGALAAVPVVHVNPKMPDPSFALNQKLVPNITRASPDGPVELVVVGPGKEFLADPAGLATRSTRYLAVYGTDRANTRETARNAVKSVLESDGAWTVLSSHEGAQGLTILTRDTTDKPAVEFGLKDIARYAWARTKHMISGGRYLPLQMADARMDQCVKCEHRTHDGTGGPANNCALCSCYLWQKGRGAKALAGEPGKVFYPDQSCPDGRWPAQIGHGVDYKAEEMEAALATRPEFVLKTPKEK